MLNFVVGPVTAEKEVLKVAGSQTPYFRTADFSRIMLENAGIMRGLFKCKSGEIVFLTGSGTAAMEAAVVNTLTPDDKALVVNGGSFGARFCEICATFGIPYTAIDCEAGKGLKPERLAPFENGGYTAFIVNLCETSTGVLYDSQMISEFCKRNGLFLIVDVVSAFLCDPFDFDALGADVALTGSQKALAVAPGVSVMCLSERALARVENCKIPSYYLNVGSHLENMKRGQTPFTPAVSTLLQLNVRLKGIEKRGGAEAEIARACERAEYFRSKIADLPFEQFSDSPSSSVTALKTRGVNAYTLFERLIDRGIWVCPNGGALKDSVFRVGHMGDLKLRDYDVLVKNLRAVLKTF